METKISKTVMDHQLYFDSATAMIQFNGQCTRLDHKTFKLLCHFVAHQDQVIERQTLINHLWQKRVASDASLGRLISVLRKILGVNGHQFIFTIHKTGYRFAIPADVRFIAVKPPAMDETPAPLSPASTSLLPLQGKKSGLIWRVGLLSLGLVLLGAWLFWLSSSGTAPQATDEAAIKQSGRTTMPRLAVLPFEQLAQQTDDGLFVEGLTTELVNSMTTIKGLSVLDWHRSLKLADNTAELTRVAKEQGVRYLLKGNIRQQLDKVRINVNLLDCDNGNTLFSTVYEREMDDVFAMQSDIAAQVAAALRLTLYHQQQDGTFAYSSALSRLDHISIEKLVIARAQINRYRKEPVDRAMESLGELNQSYPDTPEILGLLAYANAVSISVSSFKPGYSRTIERDLALQALSLDKTNFDALTTLYYYYHDFAEFQGQARQVARDIVAFHPGLKGGHKINFIQQVQNAASCRQLQLTIDSLPPGIYPGEQHFALKKVIDSCVDHGPLSSNDAQVQDRLNRIIRQFRLKQDVNYQTLQEFAQRNPNQRFLSQLYCRQLIMGADQMATATFKRLGDRPPGYWQLFAELCSYTNNRDIAHFPSHYIDFSNIVFNNNSVFDFVAALVKQFRQGEGGISRDTLSDYLHQVPAFTINVTTREQTLGLIMLQYYSGNKKQSLDTARQLLDSLNQYQRNHPDAYRFWSLGHIHFATAFYAGDINKASGILEHGFAPREAYWLHGKSLMSVVLAPWHTQPLVASYLQRIDTDAGRARRKFGLY